MPLDWSAVKDFIILGACSPVWSQKWPQQLHQTLLQIDIFFASLWIFNLPYHKGGKLVFHMPKPWYTTV